MKSASAKRAPSIQNLTSQAALSHPTRDRAADGLRAQVQSARPQVATLDEARAEFEASWKQWKAWAGMEEIA
jgi:hypothetical protein